MTRRATREALRNNCAGMTATALALETHQDRDNVLKHLKLIHGVYIDHWTKPQARSPVAWVPVFALVDVPQDCPMPN